MFQNQVDPGFPLLHEPAVTELSQTSGDVYHDRSHVKIASPRQSSSEALLLLREFSHRINNEFASAIAAISMAGAHAANDKAKASLDAVKDRLQNYARLHHTLQFPEQNGYVDVALYLRQLCRAISRSKLDSKGIELQLVERPFQMNSERCWRLGLIVSELITNAERHAFGGSSGLIRVELLPSSSFVECHVTDNGASKTHICPGHGLRIVEALAGSLGGTIDRTFGPQGTTAVLIFPVETDTPQHERGVVRSSVKIILLEDDSSDAELIQELLEADHFVCDVNRVQTCTDFLTALENDEIDLILSDYKLPSFDGLSALRLASSARPDLPFIFVSGALGEESAIEALKIGATDYVLKTGLSRLVPSVRRALREAGERAERKKAEEARQRAEHAVQANERRFRALIEHAYDVVLLSSAEGTILYASPSVQGMLGYAPEELIDRSAFDLVHPDDRQESIDRLTQSMEQAGAVVRGERLLLHKDGSSRWVENVVVNLLSEPSVQAAVIHLRDITERKEAEAALRDSEQQFRDFAESASDWYWETGPDHRFIAHLVSEQQLNAIGVLTTNRIGALRWDFARDLEDEPEKWRQHKATLDAHKPFRDFRYRAASSDGSEIYIAASGKPRFDPNGNFLGYRGVASHITAAVRTAQLEEALQEAKVVGDNIAHDLRTPLTRVRLRLERGREHASTLEEFRAVADQAIAGLDQSLTTITALLRITEIEHSRRREGFGEVQLAPLLHEVGDLYDPIAENKSLTLQVEATDGATVEGDRDLLFEAVANLVDNAVKFTPERGRVELALLHREGGTVIRVSDTGPGISETEQEIVTRRFYRSDNNRNTNGLGLGLSMVAAIVKLHGFRFTIVPGLGCTAEIACPRKN